MDIWMCNAVISKAAFNAMMISLLNPQYNK